MQSVKLIPRKKHRSKYTAGKKAEAAGKGCFAGLTMAQVSLFCSGFNQNWQRVLTWAPRMWLATERYSFNPAGCIFSMRPGKSVPDWRPGIFDFERCLYTC